MGMFDELRCRYPLPVEGANDRLYQTKDTPEQYLDLYEIREDGTLWHEAYDVEDRSDPNAKGFMRWAGCMTKVNKRWEQERTFTGEICFYDLKENPRGWIEFSAYFKDGQLQQVNLLEDRTDSPVTVVLGRIQTDRPACDNEVEVTPEMIEAGREAISSRWLEFTDITGFRLWDEVLREAFLAMWAKRPEYHNE